MSLRDQVLQNAKLQIEPVEIPEWNLTIWVRELTVDERDQMIASQASFDNQGEMQDFDPRGIVALLFTLTACDENGDRLFNDDETSIVADLPVGGVDRVFEVAQRINRLRKSDVDEAVENLG